MRKSAACLAALLFCSVSLSADEPAKKPRDAKKEPEAPERPWTAGLKRTLAESLKTGKPIVVRASAPWCGWCTKLADEVRKPEMQKELERWSLAVIDVDKDTADARRLGVGPIPALRILTPEGRPVASRDGFLTADEFVAWLKEHYESANVKPIDELVDTSEPTGTALARLIRELEQRDPVLRESAIRRLVVSPGTSAGVVVRAFESGSLQARLAAMEALHEWKAPIADLDPWRPDTITSARIAALQAWAKKIPTNTAPAAPTMLTAEEKTAVAAEVARMLAVSDADVSGIRERIARYGRRAMPVVYEALKNADEDASRQRLTALRYRLAASPTLALHWRGGLERLSATETEVRHRAAEELVQRSGAAEEDLLLELFGDPDALVRELALRGLYEASGGGVEGALVKLLSDPNANVRAAVLKQLAEKPSAAFVPKIKEYLKTETDPDLVVHAVRVFRETKSQGATNALLELFKHPNWRVRAEAVDAIGGVVGKHLQPNAADKTEVVEACLPLLKDPDPFVVAKAAAVLEKSDEARLVRPLVEAVERHPSLAPTVLVSIAKGARKGMAAAHLRRLAKSKEPLHRAAAITALAATTTESFEAEAKAGLVDASGQVRTAALNAMFSELEEVRKRQNNRLVHEPEAPPAFLPPPPSRSDESFLSALFGGVFSGSKPPPTATKVVEKPKEQKKTEKLKEPAPLKATDETEYDAWLKAFRRGEKRPAWMVAEKEKLDRSLTSEDHEERLAAALVQIALGLREDAVATLLKIAADRPASVPRAAEALPWRTWPERLDLFRKLTTPLAVEHIHEITEQMVDVRDPRAEDPLWSLLTGAPTDEQIAAYVLYALQKLHFGNFYYDLERVPAADRKAAAKGLAKRVDAGPEWSRAVALTLLSFADRAAAEAVAEKWIKDTKTPAGLRRDAIQLRLLLAPAADAKKLAVETVKGADEALLEPALIHLALGPDQLQMIRDALPLYHLKTSSVFPGQPSGERGAIPEPPKGLTAEMLRPLITKATGKGAAVAGYFLVLLEEPEGLEPLLAHWRKNGADGQWAKLVYQAVAFADDDRRVGVLEALYARRASNQLDVGDLYWTMRPMEGPRAKALRARIRKEVGVEALNQRQY
jgi:HEAT repeat protein/thiol-disulfide isomerase/thioredoxin